MLQYSICKYSSFYTTKNQIVSKLKTLIPILIFLIFSLTGCNDKNDIRPGNSSGDNDSWLVQKSDIIHWDSEKDRIRSIDTLEFVSTTQSNLDDEDLVFAVNHNGIVKVYPVAVMGGHEIANDSIDDYFYSLTYCPITGSAISWNRSINGKVNQFGVSGMLYKNNLIPYDRVTGSHWSQMGNLCINGDLIGQEPNTSLLIETKFSTIKTAYPEALVLSHHHCENGVCIRYKSTSDFGDPIEDGENDPLVDPKYYGVTKDQGVLLFSLDQFKEKTRLLDARFKGQNIIVVGNQALNYFTAFIYIKDSPAESIFAIDNQLPLIMGDSKGNKYDLFGNILEGPDKGKRLNSPNAYMANSFAWNDLFNEINVHKVD